MAQSSDSKHNKGSKFQGFTEEIPNIKQPLPIPPPTHPPQTNDNSVDACADPHTVFNTHSASRIQRKREEAAEQQRGLSTQHPRITALSYAAERDKKKLGAFSPPRYK